MKIELDAIEENVDLLAGLDEKAQRQLTMQLDTRLRRISDRLNAGEGDAGDRRRVKNLVSRVLADVFQTV